MPIKTKHHQKLQKYLMVVVTDFDSETLFLHYEEA